MALIVGETSFLSTLFFIIILSFISTHQLLICYRLQSVMKQDSIDAGNILNDIERDRVNILKPFSR